MDDNFLDDWVPLENEQATVELPLGLVTGGMLDDAGLLEVLEAAYRVAHPACHNVIFSEPSDPDDPTSPERFENAGWWREALAFPRDPTMDEVQLWQSYHLAELEAAAFWATEQYLKDRAAATAAALRARPLRPVAR